MGKGDKRTKRGKIWRGSNGKTRPKNSKGYQSNAAAKTSES
ncbi:30S ribosomal protein THX [Sphingobacteriales bacterium UPWRP_1]|nr:ribosomal small subunit protein bTHX [Sphingobacteriales bacterium TSM_CSM]PSJ73075.1 30S ribosomal protein THX [Sphingobacteriales bacterium UPWRP_1]